MGTNNRQSALRPAVAFSAILLIGVVLRIPGLFSDFWLDEIWTLYIAGGLESFLDVFTRIRHSNNHHLNTLIFFAIGDQSQGVTPWWIYRFHALAAGFGTVVLVWRIALRDGRTAAACAAVLTAASYLLIHFSSEARGYAAVVFFAVLSYWAILNYLEKKRWVSAVCLWFGTCLGLLSHLSFVYMLASLAVWLPIRLWRESRTVKGTLVQSAHLLAVPGGFAVWFYFFEVRNMEIGGGPGYDLLGVLTKTLSYTGGGPASGPMAAGAACITLVFFLWAILRLALKNRDEWIFFVLVIFLSPALILTVMRPHVLFVRYFLISITFGFLAAAYLLAEMFHKGGLSRSTCIVLVIGFIAGNSVNTATFFRFGRGGYRNGLKYIAENTVGGDPTISTDHDFRNRMVIDYYSYVMPSAKKIRYVERGDIPDDGTQWVILHGISHTGEVMETIRGPHGNTYDLKNVQRYSDLSGWNWYIYRRVP